MRAWRLVLARHLGEAMSGEGARLNGGRWNSKGQGMVYASASLSLACLELLVHLQDVSALAGYVGIELTFAENLAEHLDRGRLPEDWRRPEHPGLKDIGNEWLRVGRTPVLVVPSAIIPLETNYLLNPLHPEFSTIRVGEPRPFDWDPRLLQVEASGGSR